MKVKEGIIERQLFANVSDRHVGSSDRHVVSSVMELVVETGSFSGKYQNIGSNYFLTSFTFYCTWRQLPTKTC